MNRCREEKHHENAPADNDACRCRPPEEIQGLSVHRSDTPNLQKREADNVLLQTLHIHNEASVYTSLSRRLEQDTHDYDVISS